MSDETAGYTPTTEEVRAAASRAIGGDWFDRWLAARDASRDAEVAIERGYADADTQAAARFASENVVLRERLAAAEATIEKVGQSVRAAIDGKAMTMDATAAILGVLDAIAESPSTVLAARDAEKWDEGKSAWAQFEIDCKVAVHGLRALPPTPVNPYRGEKP